MPVTAVNNRLEMEVGEISRARRQSALDSRPVFNHLASPYTTNNISR